jgi:hypothetical protein
MAFSHALDQGYLLLHRLAPHKDPSLVVWRFSATKILQNQRLWLELTE